MQESRTYTTVLQKPIRQDHVLLGIYGKWKDIVGCEDVGDLKPFVLCPCQLLQLLGVSQELVKGQILFSKKSPLHNLVVDSTNVLNGL